MVTMQDLREAHYRHARHYLEQLRIANQLYRSGGERVWKSLSQFQQDWDQIERSQSWAAQHVTDSLAAGLCSEYPLAGSDVLLLRHTVADRITWLQAALTASVELRLLRSQCALLCSLGQAHWEAGDVARAKDFLERAIALAEETNDPGNLALAHYHLGGIAEKQFDLATASDHTQTCLDLYTALNDQRGIASAMLQFVSIRLEESRYDEAEQYAQASLERFRAIGDHPGVAHTLARMGSLAAKQRHFELAAQHVEQSYEVYRDLGDPEGQGATLKLLGVIATVQGQFAEARQWYEESLALYQRLGHQHGIGLAHMNLGENDQYTGASEQALEHYGKALAIFRSLGTVDEVANTLFRMGNTVEKTGRIEQAIQWVSEACSMYQDLGNQSMLAASLSLLGMFSNERHALAQAEAYLTDGLAAADAAADPWATASVHFNWSELERLRGAFGKARDHWCLAFEQVMSFQSLPMALEGLRYLVSILVPSGQLELAYELAYFIAGHSSTLDGVKADAVTILNEIEAQLPGEVRQAATARAQACDLDTYCDRMLSECAGSHDG